MNLPGDSVPLPLSALNDLLFCPRRAGLKFIEGLRGENEHTILGNLAHEHVDFPRLRAARRLETVPRYASYPRVPRPAESFRPPT